MTDLELELLRLGLEADAALVAALTLAGRTAEADAHIAATGYRHRLALWRDSTRPGSPAG